MAGFIRLLMLLVLCANQPCIGIDSDDVEKLREDLRSVLKQKFKHLTPGSGKLELKIKFSCQAKNKPLTTETAPTSDVITTTDVTTSSSETAQSTSVATSNGQSTSITPTAVTFAETAPTSDVITTTYVTTSSSETAQSTSVATSNGQSTSASITPTAVTCQGFQWNGKCFWVNVTYPTRTINYTEAAEMCADHNAHPANIYNNNTHYDQVMTYLRSNIPVERTGMSIWLGMTYNPSTKVLSLYNGTMTSNQVKWFPGFPFSNTAWTQMGVAVNKDPSSTYQGMWNSPPSFTADGVLCEIDE